MVPCIAGLAASLVVALYVFLVPAVKADCYSHDGILALNSKYYTGGRELVSCGNGTNNCCLDGQKCGSNLLCASTSGQSSRQYCSDISWNNCSTLCADYNQAGTFLTDCGNNVFCCTSDNTQCCDENAGYFVDPNTGVVKAASQGNSTVSPIWWQVDSSAILASTGSAKNPSTTLAATTTFTSATITLSSAIPASVSTSMGLSSSSSSSQTTPGPPSPHSLSAGAGAGIGIGGAVVLAGIAILGWLIIRRRKTRKVALHNVNDHQVQAQSESAHKEASAPGHLGLDQSGQYADQTGYELEGRMRHEM